MIISRTHADDELLARWMAGWMKENWSMIAFYLSMECKRDLSWEDAKRLLKIIGDYVE